MDLKAYIRDVPDFPKPGILFRDISPLLADARAWKACIDGLADIVRPHRPGSNPAASWWPRRSRWRWAAAS